MALLRSRRRRDGRAGRDPLGAPDYPPATDAWTFPPPALSRRWRWAAIGAPALAALVVAGVFGWLAGVEQEDLPGFLDDEEVLETVRISCAVMTTEIARVQVQGTSAERAAAVSEQNQFVETMVRKVRGIDVEVRAADRPVDAWLADWESIVRVRERWAAETLDGGDPRLRVPEDDDGEPVTRRMDLASNGLCPVPHALVEPGSGEDVDV